MLANFTYCYQHIALSVLMKVLHKIGELFESRMVVSEVQTVQVSVHVVDIVPLCILWDSLVSHPLHNLQGSIGSEVTPATQVIE